jgi:predicted site-specific integrase-resolvase
MELVHLREAARQLGVSYPTLKQWIYRGWVMLQEHYPGMSELRDE